MALYVAVANKGTEDFASGRPNGDWSCFVDADKDAAIRKALNAVRMWGSQYRVLVGELKDDAS